MMLCSSAVTVPFQRCPQYTHIKGSLVDGQGKIADKGQHLVFPYLAKFWRILNIVYGKTVNIGKVRPDIQRRRPGFYLAVSYDTAQS
jgi:hypothetical protein